MLILDDVGSLKAFLLVGLVPSTSTLYLGSRSRDIYNALELVCLNDRFPVDSSGDALMPPDYQILQVTRLQHIHSCLTGCIKVP
jgi:hypothetical protein